MMLYYSTGKNKQSKALFFSSLMQHRVLLRVAFVVVLFLSFVPTVSFAQYTRPCDEQGATIENIGGNPVTIHESMSLSLCITLDSTLTYRESGYVNTPPVFEATSFPSSTQIKTIDIGSADDYGTCKHTKKLIATIYARNRPQPYPFAWCYDGVTNDMSIGVLSIHRGDVTDGQTLYNRVIAEEQPELGICAQPYDITLNIEPTPPAQSHDTMVCENIGSNMSGWSWHIIHGTFNKTVTPRYTYSSGRYIYDTVKIASVRGICDTLHYVQVYLTDVKFCRDTARFMAGSGVCDTFVWQRNPTFVYRGIGDITDNLTTTDKQCDINSAIHSDNSYLPYQNSWDDGQGNVITYANTMCDSVHRLELHIDNGLRDTLRPNECDTVRLLADRTIWNTDPTMAISAEQVFTSSMPLSSDSSIFVTNVTNGCRDTIYFDVTVRHSTDSTLVVTACEQYTWYVRDINVTADDSIEVGTWTYRNLFGDRRADTVGYQLPVNPAAPLLNAVGCDSIVSLHLTLGINDTTLSDDAMCLSRNSEYYWADRNRTYSDLPSEQSLVHLYDTVNGATNSFGFVGEAWWDATAFSCDMIYDMSLTLYSDSVVSEADADRAVACGSYEWRGNTVTEADTYYDTVALAVHGYCDSIYRLDVNVADNDTVERNEWDEVSSCTQYYWERAAQFYPPDVTSADNWIDGHPAMAAGAVDTFYFIKRGVGPLVDDGHGSTMRCDSVYILSLTTYDSVQRVLDTAWCEGGEPFTWLDGTLSASVMANLNGSRSDLLDSLAHFHGEMLPDDVCQSVFLARFNLLPTYNRDYHPQSVDGSDSIFCDFFEWQHTLDPSDPTNVTNTIIRYGSGPTYNDLLDSNFTVSSREAYASGVLGVEGCDSVNHLVFDYDVNFCDTRINDVVVDSTVCDKVVIASHGAGAHVTNLFTGAAFDVASSYELKVADRGSYIKGTPLYEVWDTIRNGSSNGVCDSISHFKVSFYYNVSDTLEAAFCDSTNTIYGAGLITKDTLVIYAWQSGNAPGMCDSIHYLSVKINYTKRDTLAPIYACDSMIWGHYDINSVPGTTWDLRTNPPTRSADGIWYTDIAAGEVVDSLKQENNTCDSLVYLTLQLSHHADVVYADTVACGFFEWYDNASSTNHLSLYLNETNHPIDTTATHTFRFGFENSSVRVGNNIGRCDSTVELTMHIYDNQYTMHDTAGCERVAIPGYAGGWITATDTVVYTYGSQQLPAIHAGTVACSTVTAYHVIVTHPSRTVYDTMVCEQVLDFMGSGVDFVYDYAAHNGDLRPDTIVYEWTHASLGGCYDNDTLKVVLVPNGRDTTFADTCDTYTWRSRGRGPYTVSGTDKYITRGVLPKQTYQRNNGSIVELQCDSISTLILTIRNSVASTLDTAVCGSFTWTDGDGHTYDTTNYDTDHQTTKGLPIDGPVSYKYAAAAANGCDSTVTLHLAINQAKRSVDRANRGSNLIICDSYEWNGRMYTESSHTVDSIVFAGGAADGCDSIVYLDLTMGHSSYDTIYLDSCQKVDWPLRRWFFENYRNMPGDSAVIYHSGTYEVHVPGSSEYHNVDYCDSIVTAVVTIRHHSLDNVAYADACDSVVWNGRIYRSSYVADDDSLKMVLSTIVPEGMQACDSVITLHPTIRRSSPRTDTVLYACGSVRWTNRWYDENGIFVITDSIYRHIEGRDTQYDTVHALNVESCDSAIYAVLNVLDTRRHMLTTPQYHPDHMSWFCDSVVWRGRVITETGIYEDTVFNATTIDGRQLCDSIYIFDAVVHHSSVKDSNIVSTGCDIYTWNNVPYYQSTVVDDTLPFQNEEGCDSIMRVNLTVRQSTRTVERDTACDTYVWTSSRWIRGLRNRDTIAHHTHADVTVAEFDTLTQAYINSADCESFDTLLLVLYPTDTTIVDTHACELFRWQASNAEHGTYINETFRDSVYAIRQSVNNAFGCMHYDSLALFIHRPQTEVLDTAVCDSINWHNEVRLARDTVAFYETGVRDQYGCHINLQISLRVYPTVRSTDAQQACRQYTWYDMADEYGIAPTFTASGVYHDTASTVYGCDSIVTLTLTIDTNAVASVTYDTICEGTTTYAWRIMRYGNEMPRRISIVEGQEHYVYNESWPDLANPNGCDTMAHLYLTTNSVARDTMTVDTCGVYRWRGGNDGRYDRSTTVSHIFEEQAVNGCDSIVTLVLNIGTPEITNTVEYACDTFTWVNRGHVVARYDESNVSGPIFRAADITTRRGDCPIIDSLELHIRFASHNTDTVRPIACDRYTWIPFEGFPSEEFSSPMPIATTARTMHRSYMQGCDTTVYLDLQMGYSQNRIDRLPAACDSFYWARGERWFYQNVGGDTVSYQSARNAYGCDTTVVINLVVNHSTPQALGLREECDSMVFTLGAWDTSFAQPGRINFSHGVNSNGCPVNYSVDLHLRYSHTLVTNEVLCQPYTWSVNNVNYIETTHETLRRRHTYAENCDTTFVLDLTIGSVTTGTTDTTVCDSIVWRGITYTRPTDETGRFLIRDTIHRANGRCDSVRRYRLFVNASQNVYHDTIVCDFYDWRGSHNTDGAFISEMRPGVSTSNGCDSTAFLRFHVNHSTTIDSVVAQACDTFFFAFNGTNYQYTAPVQREFLMEGGNSVGCDSIVRLDLQAVYNHSVGDSVVMLCNDANPNHSNVWNGALQTATHYETVRLPMLNQYGCDSLSRVHVVVHEATRGIDHRRVCDVSYRWVDGVRYHDDIDGTSPDAPSVISGIENIYGCDSIVYLDLVLEDTIRQPLNIEACNEYTWSSGNGQRYTQSTVRPYPTYAYHRGEGLCDSIVELRLTIHRSTYQPVYASSCDYYEWARNGHTYATTGTYTADYHNEWGCESTDTLHLTINSGQNMSDTVIACDRYVWHGRSYAVSDLGVGVTHRDIMHFNQDPSCRHTDTLTITLYRTLRYVASHAVCSQYTWQRPVLGDTLLTTSGEYTFSVYLDDDVCPSLFKLDLEVMEDYQRDFELSFCNDTTIVRYLHEGDATPLYTYNYPQDGTSKEYFVTIENGGPTCTLHDNFNLHVGHSSPHTYMRDTACNSYEWWHGNQRAGRFDMSGDYTYTFTNSEGCDSTVTMYLVVHQGDTTANDTTVCNHFEWQGRTYTDNRTIVSFYTNDDGCASVDTLRFAVYHSSTGYENRVVCDSLRWDFDGQLYTRTRVITQHGVAANGICDSTVVLDLRVNRSASHPIHVNACDSYVWHDHGNYGEILEASGTYIGVPYNTAEGCRSVDTLHLSIRNSAHSRTSRSECDTAEWFGSFYTTSGMKVHNDTTLNGCPKLDTLDLIIFHSRNTVIPAVACDSYEWNGQTFTNSDTVTYSSSTVNGCDSNVTLMLTVNHNTNSVVPLTVCDSVTYRGTYFATSGVYRIDYLTPEGCPSFDTLNLTVNYNTNSRTDTTVCDSYTWHGTQYTTSGTYTYQYTSLQTGCPSVDTLVLTVNYSALRHEVVHACDSFVWRDGNTYTASTYGDASYHLQTPANCDSIILLDLTLGYTSVNPTPIRREACDVYNWVYTIGHMNGRTFVADSTGYINGITQSGNYYARFCTNASGCDSLQHLVLAMGYRDTVETAVAACGQYSYNGITYSNTTGRDTSLWVYNTIRRTYIDGCDSTTHMNIVLYPVRDNNPTEHATACDGYTWNGTRYSASGNYVYEGVTVHGCDSAVRLILVVNRSNYRTVTYDTICERINWGGRILNENGIYRDTLHTVQGCDSVLTLNLTVYHRSFTSQTREVCDQYVWPNDNLADTLRRSTTVWRTTYPDMQGCQHVDTLHLIVKYSSDDVVERTVCDSIRWYSNSSTRGAYYTRSGIYRYNVPTRNSVGCDSTKTLYLTVHPTLRISTVVTQCEPLTWHGRTYTASVSTVRTFDSVYSDGQTCRVTDTLRFVRTGSDVLTETTSQAACDSFYWSRTNMVYYASARLSDTVRNANGCDSSIATLVLTIATSNSSRTDTVTCSPVVWMGSTYTTSGTYSKRVHTSSGCDDVHTLVLHGVYMDTLPDIVACESYLWNGTRYDTEGIHTAVATHSSIYGCDSNIYQPVRIIKSLRGSLDTLVMAESFYWESHRKTFTQGGRYIDTVDFTPAARCGRIDTLRLSLSTSRLPVIGINQSHTLLMVNHYPDGENGERVDFDEYRWYIDGRIVNGSRGAGDSYSNSDFRSLDGHYYYVEVLVDNVWLRSNVIDLRRGVGIDDVQSSLAFSLYPNPIRSGSMLNVVVEGEENVGDATLEFYDLQGRSLMSSLLHAAQTTVEVTLPAGVYSVRLTTTDGRKAVRRIVVR